MFSTREISIMKLHFVCLRLSVVLTFFGVLSQCVGTASAITINLSYDTSDGNYPAYDPDGSKLEMIATAAANIWKDLLPYSNNSYSVHLHWEAFDASDPALAVFNGFDNSIRVRTNTNWFIDPTPTESGEFMPFTQELYRDLGSSQQFSWFNGSPPPLLETGYTAAAVSGGVADGKFDMLSVLTHEMGHFTEIGWNALKPDVDLSPHFIGNVNGVAVKRENESHIFPDNALLDPFISQNTRILPSALDVIVAAHEQNHSSIRLKRVDWLGDAIVPSSTYWFWDSGWEGGLKPNGDTDVTIRNQAELSVVSLPATAHSLLVAEKSTLTVSDQLSIGLDAEIRGSGFYDHPKIVIDSGSFSTGRNLYVTRGSCKLQGGSVDIGGLLILDYDAEGSGAINSSALRGFGTVQVGSELRNRGTIAGENGTLTISMGAGGTLDLDGNQEATATGHIDAKIGNLFLIGPLNDDFNGIANIQGGHSIGFAEQFAFGTNSTLNFSSPGGLGELFSSSPTSLATFNEANIELAKDISAQIRAHKIALTNLAEARLNDGSVLSLQGNIEYSGGKYVGLGTLRQNGDATVLTDTTIDTAQYDWDGNLPTPVRTTVAASANFTMNVAGFGGSDTYNGQTDLNNHAELAVNITSGFGVWQLGQEGVIRFVENARLKGSPVIVVGTLEAIEGSNHVDSQATLTANSIVMIHDKASLSFNSPIAYGGGVVTTVSGNLDDSRLNQFDTASVLGHHRITVGFFNWDPSAATDSHTTINSSGFLDIHAKQIGNGITDPLLFPLWRSGFGDTIDMNGGKLSVQVGYERRDAESFPFYWTLNKSGVLNLNLGEHALPTVLGSKLINNGLISGSGIFQNVLENRAELRVGHANDIGTIQLMNAFSQTQDGLMAFDLGGLAPTSEYDQIFHDASMQVDGTLNVSLLGGFNPSVGDTFRIIDGNPLASLTGTFSTTHLPAGNWDVIYGSYFVDLRFSAVPEPSTLAMAAAALACCLALARRPRA
jgi:hypothetical protein